MVKKKKEINQVNILFLAVYLPRGQDAIIEKQYRSI